MKVTTMREIVPHKHTTSEQFQNVLLSTFWYLYSRFICLFSLSLRLHSSCFYFTFCFLRGHKHTHKHSNKEAKFSNIRTLQFKNTGIKTFTENHNKMQENVLTTTKGTATLSTFHLEERVEDLIMRHRELAHFLLCFTTFGTALTRSLRLPEHFSNSFLFYTQNSKQNHNFYNFLKYFHYLSLCSFSTIFHQFYAFRKSTHCILFAA